MLIEHQKLKYFVIALITLLVLSACVRPLQPSEEEAEATATAVSESATEEESSETSSSEESADSTEDEQASESTDTESTDEMTAEENATDETQSEETSDAADTEEETTDSEVGGGTPDTPEEETVPEEVAESEVAEDEEAATEETEEAITEEATSDETTEETAAEEPTEEATAEESTEEAAAEETTAEETTEEAAAEETTTEAESQQQATTSSGEIIHTVAPGENLYRIGLKYGMSWVPIARYNNITDPNRIVLGQQIIIPGSSGQPPTNGNIETAPPPTATPKPPDGSSFTNYVVQPGDTLSSISRKFGVSPQEIAEANGLVNPNLIYAGQVLKIPTSTPEKPPQVTHTVKRGETLYSISLIYGVHWLSIAQANNIAPPYVIYAGQSLIIPGG